MSKVSFLFSSFLWAGLVMAPPTASPAAGAVLQMGTSSRPDTLAARAQHVPPDEVATYDAAKRSRPMQSDKPRTQFSGQIFTHYRWNTSGTAGSMPTSGRGSAGAAWWPTTAPDTYTMALNVEGRKDGEVWATGVSGFGTFRIATVPTMGTFEGIGLLDVYQVGDPDDLVFEGEILRSIVGLTYQPTEGFTLSLDYQQEHAEEAIYDQYDGEITDTDARLYLHVIANY